MGFAEFDVCIMGDDGKPGPPMERKANTSHPVVGETVDVGPKTYRVVKVHHREVSGERPPRDRAVCYLVEVKKFEVVGDDTSSAQSDASAPSVGKLVRFPSNAPPASASAEEDFAALNEEPAVEDKRVRAAGSVDPHTATTVQRAVSMSMAEHSLSLMKTSPFARGAVAVPSNGGVMKSIHDVAQLPTPSLRHFAEEPSVRGENPTLRVVVRPAPPLPVTLPVTRSIRPPVTKTEAVRPPRSRRLPGVMAGLALGLVALAAVFFVQRQRQPPVDAIVIPTSAAPEPVAPSPAPPVEAPAPSVEAAAPVATPAAVPPAHAHRRHKEAKKADSNVAPETAGDEDEPTLEGDSLHNPFSK